MTELRQIGRMNQTQDQSFSCPTFSSYSSDNLAEIAVRVTGEFNNVNPSSFPEAEELLDEEDDFEFSFVSDAPDIFYDGQIKPIFPIFNRDPEVANEEIRDHRSSDASASSEIMIPLKDLLIRDREQPSILAASSSEEQDVANVPPGTYCVWRPKVKESSPKLCNKSSSTGSTTSSKRWKFLDLLRRSNSEGNDSYVFLTPKKSDKIERPRSRRASEEVVGENAGKLKSKGTAVVAASPSAHETFYVRSRAIKEGDKKKSYLPYRQVLVGFFANVNGLSRTYPPF